MSDSIKFRFLAVLLVLVAVPVIASAQTVSVDPASQNSPDAGKTVKVEVKVGADVKGLFGYQFDVSYDSTALKYKATTEGDLLKAGAPTFFNPPKDDGKGKVTGAAATRLIKPGVNGPGTIASIEFEVVAVKDSKIDLANVKLSDENAKAIPNVKVVGGSVVVPKVNKSPTASAGKDAAAEVGVAVSFDASGSKDEDGKVVSYEWDFGDGKTEKSDKPIISHTYDKDGKYTVKVTVTDDQGAKASASVTATISAKLPAPITEYKVGMPYLAFTATYDKTDAEGSAFVNIWKGNLKIEKGMSLEYQITIVTGNPNFKAGVELQTSDGTKLSSIKDAADQNKISAAASADLGKNARTNDLAKLSAYHRKISLDGLDGKNLSVVMIGTEGGKAFIDTNGVARQLFNAYVANIQITSDKGVVDFIYKDGNIQSSNSKESSDTSTGGAKNMVNAKVVVGGAIAVEPVGKLTTTWGKMKKY